MVEQVDRLAGFAGQRIYQVAKDTELAIAVTRAWNDWMLEDWCAYKPGRMIPSQLPIWTDPNPKSPRRR